MSTVDRSTVRPLLLWALMLGASSGLIFDLRIWFNFYFFGDSSDPTLGLILENVFLSLSAMCILITRGIAERSRVLALAGALAGVLIGIITLPIGLLINPPWPLFPILYGGLIGLSAGFIWGISNPLSSRRLYAGLSGLVGGLLGVPVFYLVAGLSALSHTVVPIFDGGFSDVYLNIVRLVGLVVSGAAQSFAIWYLILRFDRSPKVSRELED